MSKTSTRSASIHLKVPQHPETCPTATLGVAVGTTVAIVGVDEAGVEIGLVSVAVGGRRVGKGAVGTRMPVGVFDDGKLVDPTVGVCCAEFRGALQAERSKTESVATSTPSLGAMQHQIG